MSEEFELTYLAKSLPETLFLSPAKEILDIYIPASADHAILRIRKRGDSYEITKKQPVQENDSSHQIENTILLTKDEFDELSCIEGKRVRKVRYQYSEANSEYEVDVFQDDLKGLVLVDVEFNSPQEKSAFTPPVWLLADVTQEEFIAGGVLCGKKYSDLEDELSTHGYKKFSF